MLCQFLLYNKVNQPFACIYPHTPSLLKFPPTFPIPLFYVVAKHRADLPVLCCCFPLANYYTFGSVYMSVLLSLCPTFPSPPPPCPQVHSLCLHLYFCPATRFISTICFRFNLHALAYGIFLFPTYFTLYDRLQVHPPHYK